MVKEGLDMYMAGEAWERAREIAKNIAPRCVIVDMSRERDGDMCVFAAMCSMWSRAMWNTSENRIDQMK